MIMGVAIAALAKLPGADNWRRAEQGFGQAPRDLTNPYLPLTPESEAWNIGWQEGKKRSAEETAEHPERRCERCGGPNVSES
jgi:hypothetical protein